LDKKANNKKASFGAGLFICAGFDAGRLFVGEA
jgi:hypothetical protein